MTAAHPSPSSAWRSMLQIRNLCLFLTVLTGALGNTSWVSGQRLHAIVAGDSSEWAGWGKYAPNITLDTVWMYSILHRNVPRNQLEYYALPMELDEDSSPRNILRLLDDVHPGPRDTLLFYYTGHGAVDDRGHYLALAEGPLYRDELLNQLRAKGARLTVLLTDCCNVRSDGEAFAAPAPDDTPPPRVTPIFQSLFFEPKGVVDINSSSPGEGAFFFAASPDFPGGMTGSIFTGTLVSWFDDWRSQRSTWDNFVRGVSLRVHIAFREGYPQGAQIAKGAPRQPDQNVYAVAYPGMPAQHGPRTGVVVREAQGRGVRIVTVRPDSPAERAYDLTGRRSTPLPVGHLIVETNGQAIRGTEDFVNVTQASPQVMRLSVQGPRGDLRVFLMRLRY